MKKILSFVIIVLMLTACSIRCCNDHRINQFTIIGCGTIHGYVNTNWKVTYFWDKDKEETHKFSGYLLSFNANNELKVTSSTGTTFVGTWSIRNR